MILISLLSYYKLSCHSEFSNNTNKLLRPPGDPHLHEALSARVLIKMLLGEDELDVVRILALHFSLKSIDLHVLRVGGDEDFTSTQRFGIIIW
jgi:hypothetical protein